MMLKIIRERIDWLINPLEWGFFWGGEGIKCHASKHKFGTVGPMMYLLHKQWLYKCMAVSLCSAWRPMGLGSTTCRSAPLWRTCSFFRWCWTSAGRHPRIPQIHPPNYHSGEPLFLFSSRINNIINEKKNYQYILTCIYMFIFGLLLFWFELMPKQGEQTARLY